MSITKTNELAEATTLEAYIEAGGNPHSVETDRILSRFVQREISHNVSNMMESVAPHAETIDEIDQEEFNGLFWRHHDHFDRLQELDAIIMGFDCEEVELIRITETEVELLQEQQANPDEVLEHWAVSSWLAVKLQEKGETVGELFDFTIWGRCTSGQAIGSDGVIQEIAAEMGILHGQQYAWE